MFTRCDYKWFGGFILNIYLRELKSNRKSLLIWSIAAVLLIIMGMQEFSAGAVPGNGDFNDFVAQMPKSIQNIMGVGVLDLSIAIDFYGVFYFYISLVAAIHAVILSSGIISKEERDKTVEFLLVKPVSRNRIVTPKLLAALTNIIVLNLAISVSSYFTVLYYSEGNSEGLLKNIAILMAGLFALEIIFAAVGAFCAAVFKKPKLSASVSTGIMLASFVLSVVLDIWGKDSFLKYFTPFKYFDAKLLLNNNYNPICTIISVVAVVALIAGAYYFYNKRDMKI